MRIFVILISFLIAANMAFAGVSDTFDRDQAHRDRIEAIDIAARSTAVSVKQHASALTADISDVLVSQSSRPGRFNQDNCQIRRLPDGGWLVVWDDERLGARKIFGCRLDSLGTPTGANVLLAGSPTGTSLVEPEIEIDTLGRVHLYYRDRSLGIVYGSRFTADLSELLAPYPVNDTTFDSFTGPFDIDIYPDGRTVVVWENYSASGSTIERRIIGSNGTPIGPPATVNTDGADVSHWVPSVAVRPGGGFMVAWEDYRNTRADVFARQYAGTGDPLGNDFAIVPPPDDVDDQYAPRVIYSPAHGYVIGWIDTRDGQSVFVQQYDPVTGRVGDNRLVSGTDTTLTNWDLAMTVSPDSTLRAGWAAFGASNDLFSVVFDDDLNVDGSSIQLNTAVTGRRWGPSLDYRRADKFATVWTEFTDDDANVVFMSFADDGTPGLPGELRLNDDDRGAPSTSPCIRSASDWYTLIAFVDQSRDAGDIFVQGLSNFGIWAIYNQQANQDAALSLQTAPALAVSDGDALVVWLDGRSVTGISGQRIYGRFCNEIGEMTSDEFLISDADQVGVKAEPAAVMAPDGRGLVAWIDNRDGSPQIYGQWLNTDGSLDGADFALSNPAADLENNDLHLMRDNANRFYAVWVDHGQSPPSLKGKWFNSDASLGGTFSYSSTVPGVNIEDIAAAITGSGRISVLFTGFDGDLLRMYLVTLDNTGTVQDAAVEIADDDTAAPLDIELSIGENGYSSAVWVDRREGKQVVYYQLLDPSLAPIGANQPISPADVELMRSPTTCAHQGRAWFAWSDPRQYGLNIYAANLIYLPTDIDDDSPTLPVSFHLAQNYPNPFNPSTVIEFATPSGGEVSLTVFNMLGRRVRTLVQTNLPAGNHQIVWDGTDDSGQTVASGIYLYRLSAGDISEERKMILLK